MRAVALGMVLLCLVSGCTKAPKTVINSIGMELIEIPAGKFTMGRPVGEKSHASDEEQVAVTLTKPFWLGKTEVTQGQWQKVMGTEPWEGQSFVQADKDCPTSCVDWNDATAFCQRLTDTDHTNGKLPAGEEYRLPTEAEWEYACRAGTTTAFSFGNDEQQLGNYGWFSGNVFSYPHAVGMKKPNPWGLYDVHGNVEEWCSDLYGEKLSGGTDPVGHGRGSDRVLRGCCWRGGPDLCRSADHFDDDPSYRINYLSFRVARSPLAP